MGYQSQRTLVLLVKLSPSLEFELVSIAGNLLVSQYAFLSYCRLTCARLPCSLLLVRVARVMNRALARLAVISVLI